MFAMALMQVTERHPELVSGSIHQPEAAVDAEKWTLKRVQGDEGSRRQGESSRLEMLEAISAWVEADVKAKAQGRDKFMAAVALNALGMLKREAEHPVAVHDKALSDDLLAGRQSLATPGLLARVAGALDNAGLDIRWAKLATLGATADGGFYPPFQLDPIDFAAIYIARQQQIAQGPAEAGMA